jgi:protein-S-isoprenylcysteine O-methyltransferase Ste14
MPHRPEPHRAGQERDGLLLTIVARWARMATQRPWRYAAAWAIGIGAVNLTLRTVLNTLPVWQNAAWAALVALVFFVVAGLHASWLARRLGRHPDWRVPPASRRTGAADARPSGSHRHPTRVRSVRSSRARPHRWPGRWRH